MVQQSNTVGSHVLLGNTAYIRKTSPQCLQHFTWFCTWLPTYSFYLHGRAVSFLGFSGRQSTCLHAYSVDSTKPFLSIWQFHCIYSYTPLQTADQRNTFKWIQHGLIVMHPHQILPTAEHLPHSPVLEPWLSTLQLMPSWEEKQPSITKTYQHHHVMAIYGHFQSAG